MSSPPMEKLVGGSRKMGSGYLSAGHNNQPRSSTAVVHLGIPPLNFKAKPKISVDVSSIPFVSKNVTFQQPLPDGRREDTPIRYENEDESALGTTKKFKITNRNKKNAIPKVRFKLPGRSKVGTISLPQVEACTPERIQEGIDSTPKANNTNELGDRLNDVELTTFKQSLTKKGFELTDTLENDLFVSIEKGLRQVSLTTPGIRFMRSRIAVAIRANEDDEYISNFFTERRMSKIAINSAVQRITNGISWGEDLCLMAAALEWNVNIVVWSPIQRTSFPRVPFIEARTIYLAQYNHRYGLILPNSTLTNDNNEIDHRSNDLHLDEERLSTTSSEDELYERESATIEYNNPLELLGKESGNAREGIDDKSQESEVAMSEDDVLNEDFKNAETPSVEFATVPEHLEHLHAMHGKEDNAERMKSMESLIECKLGAKKEKRVRCKHCEYKCATEAELLLHKYKSHTREKLCILCDKVFKSMKLKVIHVQRKHEENPYQCDICMKPFKLPSEMLRHRQVHFQLRKYTPRKKTQKHDNNMNHHTKVDSNNEVNNLSQTKSLKLFKCKHCFHTCNSENDLLIHKYKLHALLRLDCLICDELLKSPEHKRKHLLLEHGEFPFKCYVCGNGYKKPSDMLKHRDMHFPSEHALVCGLCGTSFKRQVLLNAHMNRQHTVKKKASASKQDETTSEDENETSQTCSTVSETNNGSVSNRGKENIEFPEHENNYLPTNFLKNQTSASQTKRKRKKNDEEYDDWTSESDEEKDLWKKPKRSGKQGKHR